MIRKSENNCVFFFSEARKWKCRQSYRNVSTSVERNLLTRRIWFLDISRVKPNGQRFNWERKITDIDNQIFSTRTHTRTHTHTHTHTHTDGHTHARTHAQEVERKKKWKRIWFHGACRKLKGRVSNWVHSKWSHGAGISSHQFTLRLDTCWKSSLFQNNKTGNHWNREANNTARLISHQHRLRVKAMNFYMSCFLFMLL